MINTNFNKDYVSKYFYLLGYSKKKFPLLLFMFIISSILDMIGIGLIAPFIKLATKQPHSSQNDVINYWQSKFQIASDNNFIVMVGIIIAVVFYFKSILGYYVQKKITSFSFNNKSDLINRLMRAYQILDYHFHVERNSASLVQRLLENTNLYTEMTLMSSLRFLSEMVVIICIIAVLCVASIKVTASMALMIFALIFIYDKVVKKQFQESGGQLVKSSEDILKWFHQAIYGLKEIRVLGAENYFYQKVNAGGKIYAESASRAQALQNIPRYLVESALLTVVVGMVIVTILSGDDITSIVPILGMFAIASFRLIPSINKVATSFTNMRFSTQAMQDLYNDLVLIDNIAFSKTRRLDAAQNLPDLNISHFDKLKLESVCFSYPDEKQLVLENIDLEIERGECIGLIGKSGSGKTTLIDIILGLYAPTSGSIFINGTKISSAMSSWAKLTAYIPQNFFLLDDSVLSNITLESDADKIDRIKLDKIIKEAMLEDLVASLPKGLETVIGEHGAKISGGQRQRIALARAFYHDRELIVMDEATSSLDGETENQIVQAITEMKGFKTLIVIAHRKSTLTPCDKIYQISDGYLQLTEKT